MDNLARIKEFLETVLEVIRRILAVIWQQLKNLWVWLHTRIPILGALVKRHIKNPSTVIIDGAIFVLVVYLIVGIVGFVQIYPKKSETRTSETLSQLYPFPAAKVDGSIVWAHQFLVRLRFLNTFNTQAPSDISTRPPTDTELRSRVLEGLIEDRILYLEAKNRGIRVTSEELDVAFEKQGNKDEIGPKIKQLYGMTVTQFKEILAEQVLKEKVKNQVLARTKIRHILTLDLPSAQEAKRRLDAGSDFATVVKEFTQDSKTIDTGGELGYWRKGELAAQELATIEDAIANMTVNQISNPIQTKFGFQIIQVTERTEGVNQTYEEWFKETSAKYRIKRYVKI